MKSVVILIGGITAHPYVSNDIKDNKSISKFLDIRFTEVVELDTNAVLDWGIIPLDPLLKYGDIVRFYFNPLRRTKCTSLVQNTIKRYKAKGYQVNLFCHSLGTIIALDSIIEINNLMLCGCPLELKGPISREGARFFLTPPWEGPKIACRKLIYLWSKNDIVSCYPPKDLDKFIISSYKQVEEVTGSHNFSNYLNQIQKLMDKGQLIF